MFRAGLTGRKKTGSVTDIVPQSLGMYDFNVSLKKELDGWKVISAEWTQVEMMAMEEADDSQNDR